MLFSLRAAALSLVGSVALVAPAVASEGWIADFDEAVKIAKAEKKDLFVDFTGSDWCIWCKRLDAEVFAHEEFLTAAKKNYVLVALDFPNDPAIKEKVPNPARNKELAKKYGVQGYPTLLLMSAEGEVFGQMNYMPGGPAAFVPEMEKVTTAGKKQLADAKALVEAFTKAQGDEKLAAWDKLADGLASAEEGNVASKVFVEPIRSALEFDKDNKGGRKLRAVSLLLKSGNADEAILAAGRELDPKNENGLLELCVQAQFTKIDSEDSLKAALAALDSMMVASAIKDKAVVFDLHANAAYMCMEYLKDTDRAKKYALKAKEIGTDSERALQFLDSILNG